MAFVIEVIRAGGRLDGLTGPGLEQRILAAIDAGALRLVLDLSDLTYISSAGLRVVLVAAKRIKAAGGGLVVCSPAASVNRVFEVSGFTAFLDIQPNLAAARRQLADG